MPIEDFNTNLIFFLRWGHILAGITWIGLLYFFNFVNIPFQGTLGDLKGKVNPELMPRALWWFRWGAMWTFIFGLSLLLFKYHMNDLWYHADGSFSARAMWILFGAMFGTAMWFNVWFIIWPAQKKILGWVKAGQAPAEMAGLAKRAGLASRANTYMSGPMLFGMVAGNNYSAINFLAVVVVLVVGFGIIKLLYTLSPNVGKDI